MATEKQREANRINAQKSTGPRTDAGKEASRGNALKHGMTAETMFVLAVEDPDLLDDRVDAFFRAFNPRDEFEQNEILRLAMLSWKSDRADRYEVIATDHQVDVRVEADFAALRDRVRGLPQRILPTSEQVKTSGYDAVPAADLVETIERTAEGCRYLLGQWDMLRRGIERRDPWTPFFEMSIVRLSGFEMEWIRDPRALDLLVAGRVLRDPSAELDPDGFVQGPYPMTIDRKAMREACGRRPTTIDEAAEVLTRAIDEAAGRLEEILTLRERDGDALDVGVSVGLALVDRSKESERLRRYQVANNREMDRIVRSIEKRREKAIKEKIDEAKLEILYVKGEQLGIDWGEPPDLRNEANSDEASGGCEPPVFMEEEDRGLTPPARQECPPLANSNPQSPGVEAAILRNEANPAPASVRNEAKFDLDEFDGVEWIDIPRLL